MPSKDKIIRFNTLLSATGKRKEKMFMICEVSGGRTTTTLELTDNELQELINQLIPLQKPQNDKANKMRRKIIAIAHQLAWYKEDTSGNLILKNGDPVINMPRINNWCKTRGSFGKYLNDHTVKELVTLVTNFEKVQRHQLKQKA